jgi:hypothetical protein
MRNLRIILLSSLALVMMSSLGLAQSQYTFTPIANLNDYAGYFEPATITNNGDVLFAPAMKTGGEGVLLWRRGAITTIAKGGQTAPGGGLCWSPTPITCPVFGYTFSPVQMNNHGDVAFAMTRDYLSFLLPVGANAGVYRYNSRTGLVPVMVPGTPAPGGGLFWGSFFWTSIPNNGDVYFPGWICTTATLSYTAQACPEGAGVLSMGVYRADQGGNISAVVKPGDAAPGGLHFNYATIPAANERGDVAFGGHIYSDQCTPNPYGPYCYNSVFLKDGPSGRIVSVARVGDTSPVHGKKYVHTGSTTLNAAGDFAFLAIFAPDLSDDAVLLYSHNHTVVIAATGDSMPDGGTLAVVGTAGGDIAMNNPGDIVFDATLTDGTQAIYLWRHGQLSLVAKTGTDTGAGIISDLDDGFAGRASTQLSINDAGQILFMAHFQDGGGAMMVATPH